MVLNNQAQSDDKKSRKESEKWGAILGAIDYCNQVIEAAVKVPKEEKKSKKQKKDD